MNGTLDTRHWSAGSYEMSLVNLCFCPSVGLSVCLFVHLSLSLLKTGSIFSSDFVHHDSCLVTDKASFFKKRFWWTEFGPSSPKSGPKCLQQYLPANRGKDHEKNWRPKFGPNWPKSGRKLCFFAIFYFFFVVVVASLVY